MTGPSDGTPPRDPRETEAFLASLRTARAHLREVEQAIAHLIAQVARSAEDESDARHRPAIGDEVPALPPSAPDLPPTLAPHVVQLPAPGTRRAPDDALRDDRA